MSLSDNCSIENNMTVQLTQPFVFHNPMNVPFIKVMFIVSYILVFICCCVGNSLVLIIILRNARMRTRPYVFLANLAVADLSVGIFCVLPSLFTFLSPVWLLGKVMCKVYYFVQGMSYMTSILLLTVISVERFVATMFPLQANQIFTPRRLVIAQVSIWLLASVYNIPQLVVFDLYVIPAPDGGYDKFCFLLHNLIDMKLYYTFNVILWYIVPVVIMGFMYSKISVTLWLTSARNDSFQVGDSSPETKISKAEEHGADEQAHSSTDSRSPINRSSTISRRPTFRVNSNRALKSRRKVIRLLLVILISFIVCVLPHNVRLFLIHWELYPTPSFLVSFFPPIAFLMLYVNSALNPFLYCLLSNTFRRKIKELSCRCCARFDPSYK